MDKLQATKPWMFNELSESQYSQKKKKKKKKKQRMEL